MLVMSRRAGETILIGDDIEIVIAHIGRSRVKVGIRAPRTTPIVAREVKLVREENLAAASAPSHDAISRLASRLKFSVGPQTSATQPDEFLGRTTRGCPEAADPGPGKKPAVSN